MRIKFWNYEGKLANPIANIDKAQMEYAFKLCSRIEFYIYQMNPTVKTAFGNILTIGE